MTFYLYDLPPKIHKPSLTKKKKIRENPNERHFTNYLTNTHQNCQGHQGKV